MQRGNPLEEAVHNPEHINLVLAEIEETFPKYFSDFQAEQPKLLFAKAIANHESERQKYLDYMDLDALREYDDDPAVFKRATKTKCPIILRCLMSQDEVMKQYKRAFNEITGRQLLDGVRKISEFAQDYVTSFDEIGHERIQSYADLKLDLLNEPEYGCPGVIGYGVQSSLLYGQYPHAFAHRSQNAVWALYFITNRKDFGLQDASEFLMVQPKYNTCEQNYFFPADLFGFYALKLYLMLKKACKEIRIDFSAENRYIYLSAFTDFITDVHRNDINVYTRSSDNVEESWH